MRDPRDAAIDVLSTGDAAAKAARAREAAASWRAGALASLDTGRAPAPVAVLDRPNRPPRPELVAPGRAPKRKLGSPAGRAALLHALAHIELNAIDIAFDAVARFAHAPELAGRRDSYIGDWMAVGDDEARHFQMLRARLADYDVAYGDLPAHDGLWAAAARTADDIAARLAVAPLVLEARGLDVTPDLQRRLREAGDTASAETLGVIYQDEIQHVATGARWFVHVCHARAACPETTFRALVAQHAEGAIKGPFNATARAAAGLPPGFYQSARQEPAARQKTM